MRCFLKPQDPKGRELYQYLKLEHYDPNPLRDMTLYYILADNEVYHSVRQWLYVTDSVVQMHGLSVFWVTMRNLSNELHHTHAMVEIKCRPAIHNGVVYRQSMGVRVLLEHCIHFGYNPSVFVASYNSMCYDDVIQSIFTIITRECVTGEMDVRGIMRLLEQKYHVIISLDFLKRHIGQVKIMLENMKFLDENCTCKSLRDAEVCICRKVLLKFQLQDIKDFLTNKLD